MFGTEATLASWNVECWTSSTPIVFASLILYIHHLRRLMLGTEAPLASWNVKGWLRAASVMLAFAWHLSL